ncbi:MAG TPA: hypothetical protein VGK54_14115 [Chloroflexota bacterium]
MRAEADQKDLEVAARAGGPKELAAVALAAEADLKALAAGPKVLEADGSAAVADPKAREVAAHELGPGALVA